MIEDVEGQTEDSENDPNCERYKQRKMKYLKGILEERELQ